MVIASIIQFIFTL